MWQLMMMSTTRHDEGDLSDATGSDEQSSDKENDPPATKKNKSTAKKKKTAAQLKADKFHALADPICFVELFKSLYKSL